MERNEELLLDALLEMEAYGDEVLAILCGDFNVALANSLPLSRKIADGDWVDAALALAHIQGVPPANTYEQGNSASRIDMILLNRAAARSLVDVEVMPFDPGGIRSHHRVRATFEFSRKASYANATRLCTIR